MWTSLADYYIRRGLIEKARDVYEEGLTTVTTVRDFSLIFDTLTQVRAEFRLAMAQALGFRVSHCRQHADARTSVSS